MSATQATPEVVWAQRSSADDPEKNYVYLTLNVPDVPKDQLKLDLKETSLTFTGTSTTKKTTYHVELTFYAEIDPEQSKTNHTAANIQIVLRKKELKAEYWPRLLKDDRKMHYLKTDFDKWVDEDEQDEAGDDDYMNQFGGAGGAGGMPGMGGMGGMGGDGGFGGIDFSQLGAAGGGMPGMPGMSGMPGMPGMEGLAGDEDDEEEDDDDMPDLEDEKEEAEPAKGKGKIEEVA